MEEKIKGILGNCDRPEVIEIKTALIIEVFKEMINKKITVKEKSVIYEDRIEIIIYKTLLSEL